MSKKSALNPIAFWLLVLGVIVGAALVLAWHWSALRWAQVVWHQLAAGLSITLFGGMLAGWGIAAFIASSKGNLPPKSNPSPGAPRSPDDPAPRPPTGESDKPKAAKVLRPSALKPEDPLTNVPGIGPERAKAAATLGFEKLADVESADHGQQQQLKVVLGTALFTALVIIAHNSLHPGRETRREPAGEST